MRETLNFLDYFQIDQQKVIKKVAKFSYLISEKDLKKI